MFILNSNNNTPIKIFCERFCTNYIQDEKVKLPLICCKYHMKDEKGWFKNECLLNIDMKKLNEIKNS